MSDGEAALLLDALASVIRIVDDIEKIHDAVTNETGLPRAFDEASSRLPFLRSILKSIDLQIQNSVVDEATCMAMMPIVVACEQKARGLEEIFQKVVPQSSESRMNRYLGAAKALESAPRVEILMKGMLEDIQLLASNHGMRGSTTFQVQQIAEAIRDISESEFFLTNISSRLTNYSL